MTFLCVCIFVIIIYGICEKESEVIRNVGIIVFLVLVTLNVSTKSAADVLFHVLSTSILSIPLLLFSVRSFELRFMFALREISDMKRFL